MKVQSRFRSLALWCLLPCALSPACKTVTDSGLATDESATQNEVVNLFDFVRVNPLQKSELMLKGAPYRFSAANSYSMLKSKDAADKQFAMMKEMGVNALRMWGFWNGGSDSLQPSLGNYSEKKWEILDYVIARAGKENIKLILPLANYWDEFGGIVLLNKWVGHPDESKLYHDREIFYRDDKSKKLYQDYVIHMLNRRNTITGIRYKNDPAIMMWEPMNEARGRSDVSGWTVANWLAWASKLIKDNDPNHLVGTGTEGFFKTHARYKYYPWQAGNPPPSKRPNGKIENTVPEGSYFELDCKIPTIDLCSIHAWPFQWFIEPSDKPDEFLAAWIDEHIDFMKSSPEYNKPLYLAEFGWQLFRKDGDSALATRERVFKNAYFKNISSKPELRSGIAGIGFWNMSENEYPDPNNLTFDVTCPRDKNLCAIIKDFSRMQTSPQLRAN